MPDKSTTTPEYWENAKKELSAADPVMGKLIDTYPKSILSCRGQPFYSLSRAIVGQQISVKAADSIWKRLEQHIDFHKPSSVFKHSPEDINKMGLTRQKSTYLHDLAEHFERYEYDHAYFEHLNDEEIYKKLIAIKGVGPWSVDMFLIFVMMRPNVLPLGDIGLLNAIDLHYPGSGAREKKSLDHLQKRWSPWNTVATWYLWRSLDPEEVEY